MNQSAEKKMFSDLKNDGKNFKAKRTKRAESKNRKNFYYLRVILIHILCT